MKLFVTTKQFLTSLLLFTAMIMSAQNKVDTVIMNNGEKREGKVTQMLENSILFVYKGETLSYEFKKSEINKIVFASGRTETISNASTAVPVSVVSSAADRRGKIAVLPFEFITNDPALNVNSMAEQLQADSFLSIKENTHGLEIQDPITTNSILAKNKIAYSNLKTVSPEEMATLLGVENVVYGIANVTNKGTSTYGSGLKSYDDKDVYKKEGGKETTKSSGSAYSSNSATTMINYQTKINLNIFNDKGTNLYSESRDAFGTGFDAYHATINYLIKRCPFGSKVKH